MHWSTWRVRHTGGHHPVIRRREIRAPDRRPVTLDERAHHVVKPIGIRASVVVDICDDVTGSSFEASVARHAQAQVLGRNQPNRIPRSAGGGPVCRTVVDDDYLIVWIIK